MGSKADFGSLLKQSKVLQLSSRQPVSITSHGGYLSRGDFGLKRPLPKQAVGKTPFIRLSRKSGIDGSDFESSGKQALFVQRWDESGLSVAQEKADVVPFLEATPFDRQGWARSLPLNIPEAQRVEVQVSKEEQQRIFHLLTEGAKQAIEPPLSKAGQAYFDLVSGSAAATTQNAQLPEVSTMSDKEFDAYLEALAKLPPAFKAFLEHQAAKDQVEAEQRRASLNASAKLPPSQQQQQEEHQPSDPSAIEKPSIDLFAHAQDDSRAALDFIEFAARVSKGLHAAAQHAVKLDPMPHPTSGLSYLPPNRVQLNHLQRPLPARYVQSSGPSRGRRGMSEQDNNISTALGMTASTLDAHSVNPDGVTQFLPPKNADNTRVSQQRNKAAGRGLAWVQGTPTIPGNASASIKDSPFNAFNEDGRNDRHAPVYRYEKPLSDVMAAQQMAKGGLVGRPAALPELKLKYLSPGQQTSSDGTPKRAAPWIGSVGSREWVNSGSGQAQSEAELEAQRREDSSAAEFSKMADALNRQRAGKYGKPRRTSFSMNKRK